MERRYNPNGCDNVESMQLSLRATGRKYRWHKILAHQNKTGYKLTTAERHLAKLAAAVGVAVDSAQISAGVRNLVDFLRACNQIEEDVRKELRNFGPNKQRETRQRILAASADFTPIRLCGAAANANYSSMRSR